MSELVVDRLCRVLAAVIVAALFWQFGIGVVLAFAVKVIVGSYLLFLPVALLTR